MPKFILNVTKHVYHTGVVVEADSAAEATYMAEEAILGRMADNIDVTACVDSRIDSPRKPEDADFQC